MPCYVKEEERFSRGGPQIRNFTPPEAGAIGKENRFSEL
jgi:hypothetical protein